MRAVGERGSSRARLALAVRGSSDPLRVLGGRGAAAAAAAAAEEDLPELSDSGDEAAWEDEDDAALPRDKQQTPCLFCDRFVRLGARPGPRGSVGAARGEPSRSALPARS